MGSGVRTKTALPVLLMRAAYEWVAELPLLAVAFAAAVVMGFADIAANPAILTTVLGDTDDAARLVQVRELLAGQGWFDMRMLRFGGADPLISHWSRIIDLPLAAMIAAMSPVFGQATAEALTRVLWPTMMCGVIAFIVARFCERQLDPQISRQTALLALLLAVPCTGHFQFTPGRIDHHNVMIIGAVGGTFALLAALDRPRAGWIAGALLGLGCAVGFEGLGLTLAVIAIVSVTAIVSGGNLGGLARAGTAFAGTLLAGYMLFGPARPDTLIMCDVLSVNLILLAGCGAAGLVGAHRAREGGRPVWQVFGIVAASGAIGLALYGYVQPLCFRGPYAQVEPRLWAAWLNNVSEVRSLYEVSNSSLTDALSFAGYPLLALGYGWLVMRQRLMPHARTYFAVFVVTVLLGLWQVRLLPYASFLSVPLIAIGLFRQQRRGDEPRPEPVKVAMPVWGVARGALAVVAGLAVVGFVMMPGRPQAAVPVTAAAVSTGDEATAPNFKSCTSGDSIMALAGLPKGLAANDIDLGPFLVAWTKLSVLSGPYHRMGRSIMATHDLLHASAAEAPLRMKALGVRYVVLCKGLGDTVAVNAPGDALRGYLLSGRVPDGLEAVAVAQGPVKVWRLVE